MAIGVAPKSATAALHLHHYLLAYALGLFAAYDHWVSLALLALCTGVFVQGLGAYDYASFFTEDTHCAYFVTPNGEYSATDYLALTTRGTGGVDGAPFRARMCLVDARGYADLQAPGAFGAAGIAMEVHSVPPAGGSEKEDAECIAAQGYFPTTGCVAGLFPGTAIPPA